MAELRIFLEGFEQLVTQDLRLTPNPVTPVDTDRPIVVGFVGMVDDGIILETSDRMLEGGQQGRTGWRRQLGLVPDVLIKQIDEFLLLELEEALR